MIQGQSESERRSVWLKETILVRRPSNRGLRFELLVLAVMELEVAVVAGLVSLRGARVFSFFLIIFAKFFSLQGFFGRFLRGFVVRSIVRDIPWLIG